MTTYGPTAQSKRTAPQTKIASSRPKRGGEAPPEAKDGGLVVVLQRLSVTDKSLLQVPYMFQCPPLDAFPRSYSWAFTDYDTIGAGMHTRPGSSNLATVTFRSLFVDYNAPFQVKRHNPGAAYNPVYLAERLKAIGNAKTPFQLLAGQPKLWGIHYDVNMAVTMRSLEVEERAGEPDARYFSISFTEFRGVPLSELTAGMKTQTQIATGDKIKAIISTRNLPAGQQTMRQLAKKYYGSVSLWRVIAKASGLSVAGDVNLKTRYERYVPPPKVVIPALPKKKKK